MVLSLFPFQAADGHKHSLLDRAPPERPLAVAGQGLDADGLPEHPLLQRVLKDEEGGTRSNLEQGQNSSASSLVMYKKTERKRAFRVAAVSFQGPALPSLQ